jgi:hypothetical protein
VGIDLLHPARDCADRGDRSLGRALTEEISRVISSVAFAICTASDFTSEATTAKPRPAAPARAASIVALSARRFVCSAMS